MNPKVTFVVPCYNLAHLLGECIQSMLTQTYEDFEILVMDDCSPDDTPAVARSFADHRVKHIRNEPNLGHLRNYNKGISLARGAYIWLVSADDRLRTPDALERYVRMMDAHPHMGFVCCPAIELRDGRETGLAEYSVISDHDVVFEGHDFLDKLLYANVVIASSGMVRRACYEKCGDFPLDMPYAGDWYLWCLFALHFDVGYIADPLVNYRGHDLSMTVLLKNKDARILIRDKVAVLWRIKRMVEKIGAVEIAQRCDMAIANEYARIVAGSDYLGYQMTLDEFEDSLSGWSQTKKERDAIRATFFASLGDMQFRLGNFAQAKANYSRALRVNPLAGPVWIKRLLLQTGNFGIHLRTRRIRQRTLAESSLVAKIQGR